MIRALTVADGHFGSAVVSSTRLMVQMQLFDLSVSLSGSLVLEEEGEEEEGKRSFQSVELSIFLTNINI